MAERTITKVRIEYHDGTYIELNTPEGCAAWWAMAKAQASFAMVHGRKYEPLPWTGTAIEPSGPGVVPADEHHVSDAKVCPFHGESCTSDPPWDGITCGRAPR